MSVSGVVVFLAVAENSNLIFPHHCDLQHFCSQYCSILSHYFTDSSSGCCCWCFVFIILFLYRNVSIINDFILKIKNDSIICCSAIMLHCCICVCVCVSFLFCVLVDHVFDTNRMHSTTGIYKALANWLRFKPCSPTMEAMC